MNAHITPHDLIPIAQAVEEDGTLFKKRTDENGEYDEIIWSRPQFAFLKAREQYPLFVGGFGSGKSTTMVGKIHAELQSYPGALIGAYAPTYDLLKLITIPKICDFLERAEIPYFYNASDYELTLDDGHNTGIIFRSLSNPERIVGYETLRGHIDELDTLPKNKARQAWNNVIARNRQKVRVVHNGQQHYVRNGVAAYTTPEGYRFCYDQWVQRGGDNYAVYRSPTSANARNLPPDYIKNLLDTYDAELVRAYLLGLFVNLNATHLYRMFDRRRNFTDLSAPETEQERLYVGMDFNVGMCTASIMLKRDGVLHQIDEIFGAHDTPAMIDYLDQKYPVNPISVYPDASGQNRNTTNGSPSNTDKAILKSANFTLVVDGRNPAIVDRINSVNAALRDGNGKVRYKVNPNTCPNTIETLEQQTVDTNGMPDKKAGLDHMGDNVGYVIAKEFPIVRSTVGYGITTQVKTTRRR